MTFPNFWLLSLTIITYVELESDINQFDLDLKYRIESRELSLFDYLDYVDMNVVILMR